MIRVSIVMVNYKTPDLVVQCLDSIAEDLDSASYIKVYIGDAESSDCSLEIINSHIETKSYKFATCYSIGGNYGFAYGNNYVLARSVLPDIDVDYVHFLNPDTYLHRGAIKALVEVLRTHPDAGVAGSRLENPDGSFRSYGFRFPSPWREFFRGARLPLQSRVFPKCEIKIDDLTETRIVDWVTGASFMMPIDVIRRVGMMDARYFLYFEETEYMSRVRKAGYEIWHASESRVVHLQGSATGLRTDDGQKRLPIYWFHSHFKFFCDRYGRSAACCANILFLLGDAIYRMHRVMRFKRLETPPYLWRDMLSHGFEVPTAEGPRPRIRRIGVDASDAAT